MLLSKQVTKKESCRKSIFSNIEEDWEDPLNILSLDDFQSNRSFVGLYKDSLYIEGTFVRINNKEGSVKLRKLKGIRQEMLNSKLEKLILV